MRKLFKDALKITNNSIILTIPLVLCIMIIDLYSLYSKYTVDSTPKLLLASLTILFMFGVFASGWFYMVRQAVELSKKVFVLDSDRAKASFNLIKSFPEGIGKYFLSFVGVYIIFFFIQIIATPLVYILGVKIIGGLDEASVMQLQTIMSDTSNAAVASFIDKLSPEQIGFFGKWSLLFMLVTSLIMYLLMLWFPEILYKTPNPVIALWRSMVKLFKDFFNSFRLFLSLWLMGFALLFLNSFSLVNPFWYFLMSVMMFYLTVYFVVLIFLYYDRNFAGNDEK